MDPFDGRYYTSRGPAEWSNIGVVNVINGVRDGFTREYTLLVESDNGSANCTSTVFYEYTTSPEIISENYDEVLFLGEDGTLNLTPEDVSTATTAPCFTLRSLIVSHSFDEINFIDGPPPVFTCTDIGRSVVVNVEHSIAELPDLPPARTGLLFVINDGPQVAALSFVNVNDTDFGQLVTGVDVESIPYSIINRGTVDATNLTISSSNSVFSITENLATRLDGSVCGTGDNVLQFDVIFSPISDNTDQRSIITVAFQGGDDLTFEVVGGSGPLRVRNVNTGKGYATIGRALEDIADGLAEQTTISLLSGVFNEPLDTQGKNIRLVFSASD